MAVTFENVGDGDWIATVTQTGAAPASEEEIELPFATRKCRLMRIQAALTAGTGTSIAPEISDVTAGTGNSVQVRAEALAADPALVDAQPLGPTLLVADSGGSLFYRPVPNNAASDHTVTTKLWLREGWLDTDSRGGARVV